jgi:PAS domain S-box-containing protein
MGKTLRALMVEDCEGDANLIVRALTKAGYDVAHVRVETGAEMSSALSAQEWDIVICDFRLPRFDAPSALRLLQETGCDIPFIVVSGNIGESLAVEMMKSGASDYLLKDSLARLAPAVERELGEALSRRARRQALEQIRRDEARYRAILESTKDGFWIVDTSGRFLDVNQAYCLMIGYSREELLRMGIPDVEAIEAREDTAQRIQHVVEVGSVRFETRHRCKDGLVIDVEVSTTHSPAENSLCVFVRDITARKRQEAERESTLALLRLLNSSSETQELLRSLTGFLQRDSGCEAVGVRLRSGHDFPYVETRGFTPQFVQAESRLCNTRPDGTIPVDGCGNPLLDCMCGDVLSGRFDPQTPFFTPNGSFWTNCATELLATSTEAGRQSKARNRCIGEGYESVALIPLTSGGVTYGLLQFNDKRKNQFPSGFISRIEMAADAIASTLHEHLTQAALQASEQRYRLISENTVDVIWILDAASLRFKYVSPSVERQRGYTPAYCLAESLEQALTPESYSLACRLIPERIAAYTAGDESARTTSVELYQPRADGSIFPVEVVATMLADGNGIVREILGVTRDISERKRADLERKNLEEQLRQAQKLESIGRLAGGVAHDFNNLLTVINGHSMLLLAQMGADDPARDSLEEILKAGERAAGLTKQLLAFSRKQIVSPKRVDLNLLVVECRNLLERLIGEDLHLATNLASGLGQVMADPGQIHQVLMNLAVNARDAMPRGGTLTIETANVDLSSEYASRHPEVAPGPCVLLAVKDTGHGISEEIRERIFDPFFTTKREGEGTGLGLSTVYGIVRQGGGSIEVASETGRGTQFLIYWPRTQESTSGTAAPPASGLLTGGRETILLVEDQAEVRRLVVTVLKGRGYQVLEAGTGSEALELAERHPGPVHLMITDVVMPGMNGKELAERMTTVRPEMKVLFSSGYPNEVIAQQSLLETDVSFLQKPFTPSGLASKVREMLKTPRIGSLKLSP